MRYIVLALSVLLCVAACNKKPTPNYGTESKLRSGKWKLASGTVKLRKPDGKDTTVDYMQFIPECYKDDYFMFDSMNMGRRFTGSTTCSPADPEYFSFYWDLKDNAFLSLYNGLNYIYGITDTIQPFELDTLSWSPLEFDTVIGQLDTILPPKLLIQLDTIRKLKFYGIPGGVGETGVARGGFDIFDGDLINFSESSFTLHFQMHSYYWDSTQYHGASFLLPLGTPDPDPNPGYYGRYARDTFDYNLTFRKQ